MLNINTLTRRLKLQQIIWSHLQADHTGSNWHNLLMWECQTWIHEPKPPNNHRWYWRWTCFPVWAGHTSGRPWLQSVFKEDKDQQQQEYTRVVFACLWFSHTKGLSSPSPFPMNRRWCLRTQHFQFLAYFLKSRPKYLCNTLSYSYNKDGIYLSYSLLSLF